MVEHPCCLRMFSFVLPKVWNSLPLSLSETENFVRFQEMLKSLLF